jgi:exosome complex exonuclease DIS3/RRP44
MLPKPLTEDICSLRADVERLAFSVFWRVDPATMLPRKDVKPRFTKSIIKSSKALTYQKAQEIIDDEANDTSDLANDLRRLRDVSKALRAKRMEQGALTLASPEVRFELDDETSNPLDVSLYVSRETNKMVEEMMLLANIAVAERISEHYPSFALLRRHPEPREKMFLPLLETAKLLGLENKINCTSNKTLAESLDVCVRDDDPYFNTLLRLQATRCMSTAKYCSTGSFPRNELYHYGLAAPLYTHFTSPIRRYADVIVHRLLSASLGLISIDEVLVSSVGKKVAIDNTNLFTKEIAETCNARHLAGQQAGRASAELHTLKFFKDRTTVAEARVFQIRDGNKKKTNSSDKNEPDEKKGEEEEEEIVAFVPKYGIEARVKVSKTFNARQNMFGKLKVKIEVEQMPFGRSKLNVSIVE